MIFLSIIPDSLYWSISLNKRIKKVNFIIKYESKYKKFGNLNN